MSRPPIHAKAPSARLREVAAAGAQLAQRERRRGAGADHEGGSDEREQAEAGRRVLA